MVNDGGQRGGRAFSSHTARPGWGQHWDPHPICWLVGTLRAAPYGWRSLGMRTCPSGGVAITFPGTDLLVGAAPVDRHRVVWSMHTHHPGDPDGHVPMEFGTFVWVRLDAKAFDRAAMMFRFPDGSALTVADVRGKAEVRYRIVSRADPVRVISGTETWADLAAVERIAAEVHVGMRTAIETRDPTEGSRP